MIGPGTRRLRNQKASRDHLDYSIIKNTEKNPGDLKRLAEIPMRNHQLTLV